MNKYTLTVMVFNEDVVLGEVEIKAPDYESAEKVAIAMFDNTGLEIIVDEVENGD